MENKKVEPTHGTPPATGIASFPRMELKQPVQQMAKKSVELIKNKIDGKDIDTLTVLPVEFVDGGTTR